MLKQLTNNIYYLPATDEADRPTLGYIKGTRCSLIVDAGNSKEHTDLFQQELYKANLPIADYVAITHWHWDHTFGMHAIAGKTIASRLTNERLKTVATWEWTEEAMQHRLQTGEDITFCDTHIRVEYPNRNQIVVKTADVVFENHLTIDLGNLTCELIRVGGPHSEDSVIIYVPEEKVLFMGDVDCSDYYHNNGKYDKVKLEELIQILEAIDFTIGVLGHDLPQSKQEIIDYQKEELAKI
ncbi:MBL fold metallo-hydrolase [Paludicola sp. MB14-C6]|uniref:MBL fold metallo-hydrolase n=1 Tax=Paludihabitans sp. MB14-C6 TaxID=3070656 RepID=UPI0027DDC077|nr:MBL fold metallo-hydrolase [Paludicola sp. MB14-C6]WMJ23788.1 MBL fold metallo-hydrolase [Paludicola sp. MB14-C6]